MLSNGGLFGYWVTLLDLLLIPWMLCYFECSHIVNCLGYRIALGGRSPGVAGCLGCSPVLLFSNDTKATRVALGVIWKATRYPWLLWVLPWVTMVTELLSVSLYDKLLWVSIIILSLLYSLHPCKFSIPAESFLCIQTDLCLGHNRNVDLVFPEWEEHNILYYVNFVNCKFCAVPFWVVGYLG